MNFPNSYSVTGGISFLVYYGSAWVRPSTITLPATLSNCGGTTLNTSRSDGQYTADFNTSPYNTANSTDIRVTTAVPVAAFDITITYDSGTNTVTVSGESCASAAVALATNTVAAANIAQGSTNNVVRSFTLTTTTADATLNAVSFTNGGNAVYTTDITNYKLLEVSTYILILIS